MLGVQVTIHDDLLPFGVDSDDVYGAITVDMGDTELHSPGTREKMRAISAELDRSTDVIMEQAAELDALRTDAAVGLALVAALMGDDLPANDVTVAQVAYGRMVKAMLGEHTQLWAIRSMLENTRNEDDPKVG